MHPLDHLTTRDVPVEPARATLLLIDVQNYCATPEGGEWAGIDAVALEEKAGWFFRSLRDRAAPNMARLQAACRAAGIEVMYTTIESLTRNGRDRSLDYKITGFNVPRGSWDGRVIDALAPAADEIVIPKTSSDVFVSTNIDYVLRNLGTQYLIVAGIVTDQCVESTVRHACDRGYLVTLVTDACTTYSQERHDWALRAIRGYCRQVTTTDLVGELAAANV